MADKTLLVKVRSIFSAAANRVNLVSGEDLEVSLGKISKWLGDLKTVAFTGSYNDLTNKPTIPTPLGYTPVNKAGDTMDGSLTFKDANSNDSATINADYDDYFAIEAETGKIILLDGPTEIEGYLQLNTVSRPSTEDNDNCQMLGWVYNSDDDSRFGRVVRLYKSDIGLNNVENKSSATIRSEITSSNVTSALGYTPVNKAGDAMTASLTFTPSSGSLCGIAGPLGTSGTPKLIFNSDGSLMEIGYTNISGSYISITPSGISIDGYKIATINDIPSAAVTGVKGNTETNYRTGNVNITAANIGAVRYDTSSQGLTSTQKSNARTNLGLGSAATYSSSSFATSTQGGYAADFNSNFKPIFTTSGQSHASVFRGKYLGSSFTSAQKKAIANGTFDDLFVGDYWTIGGVNWRIADINYFKSTANTVNHLVIMPDSGLYIARMNATNTTSGGYYGSEMRSTNLSSALTTIRSAFGSSYIYSHKESVSNAVDSNGLVSGGITGNFEVILPSACMMFGSPPKVNYSGATDWNSGNAPAQLALCRLAKEYIEIAGNMWLRDVASTVQFHFINGSSAVCNSMASSHNSAISVRPIFCLKGA